MDSKSTSSRTPSFSVVTARADLIAGLVSSTLAIPLAMAFGMFAFVTLGDEYFVYGAMAGLISAAIAGLVCVLLGDRSTRVYAPRITTTFFLGLLLYSLSHSPATADAEPDVAATLLVFFAIILFGGLFQAGIMRLGSLIKFAPHPVMAGFQNMAAVLLFLVQLGNVLGYEHNIPFTRAFGGYCLLWYGCFGLRRNAGPDYWSADGERCDAHCVGRLFRTPDDRAAAEFGFSDPVERTRPCYHRFDRCASLRQADQPGELRAGDDSLLIRLGIANAVSASFGGITNGINIGPSLANRAFGGLSWVSVCCGGVGGRNPALSDSGLYTAYGPVGGDNGDCHPAHRSLDQATCRAIDQA